MATRKPTSPHHPDALPGEQDITRVYRAGAADAPPPDLDARILAEARRAVTKSATVKSVHHRWAVPLSTAAVVVLAVGVVLLMSRQGALNHRAELEMPGEYSPAPGAPPAADAATRELRDAAELARSRLAAPESPARRPEFAEALPAKPAPADTLKKAEAPPITATPATAPQVLGAAQEADHLTLAREEQARARSAPAGVATMKTSGADVFAVQAGGSPGAYTFNVTVKSPDTGCQQYADWWEVVSADGRLLYRRVLLHSHVDEQPFTRSGGPVPVQPDTIVWIRAHMNTSGYGGAVFKGSVKTGFKPAMPEGGFAADLAAQPPLPAGCDF